MIRFLPCELSELELMYPRLPGLLMLPDVVVLVRFVPGARVHLLSISSSASSSSSEPVTELESSDWYVLLSDWYALSFSSFVSSSSMSSVGAGFRVLVLGPRDDVLPRVLLSFMLPAAARFVDGLP